MYRNCTGRVSFVKRSPARAIVLLMLCASFLAGCKKGPDASTPKKAAAIFALAAQNGDLELMHQVATGTPGEFELAKGLGQMTAAFGRFSAAAGAKFGTDGNTRGMSIDLAKDFADAEEKIDGDSAELIPNPGNSAAVEPTHLKKEGGNWKVDLSFLDKDTSAKEASEKMPAIAKVWDQATAEVQAGKFETFAQASAAVKFRVGVRQLSEPEARKVTARADISSLEAALEAYKQDAAEYPLTFEGLVALTEKPASVSNWHGPYLKNSVVKDPWGNAYIYQSPGAHNANTYDLHSMGPDGKDGTADDIANWDTDAAK